MANNTVAKCSALRDGLHLAMELGIVKLDAKVFSDLFFDQSISNLVLNPIILDCRRTSCELRIFKLRHIYREANKVADFLAKMARDTGGSARDSFVF